MNRRTWSTKQSKVLCMHWILSPVTQISHRFALREAVFEIHVKGCPKLECTDWPQNDLENSTVKSTLCALNTHPETQISLRFSLRPAVFEIQGCQSQNCTEWPRNDLNHLTVKSTMYTHWILTPEAQIALRFAPWLLIFQIIEVFGFPRVRYCRFLRSEYVYPCWGADNEVLHHCVFWLYFKQWHLYKVCFMRTCARDYWPWLLPMW